MYLALARTSDDPGSCREMAARLLLRAERVQERKNEAAAAAEPVKSHDQGAKDMPITFSEVPRVAEMPEWTPPLSRAQQAQQASMQVMHSVPIFDGTEILRGGDLQQGCVSDCSFVSSLEVATEHDARWGTRLATQALYPQDASGRPCRSLNGIYHAELYWQGQRRRVVVDESVPCSPSGELLAMKSRGRPQLWPALLEKAYLTAHRSGYDFHGSDSAGDLYMLTGWLPENVALRDRTFQQEKTWRELWSAWQQGDCMLTLGTGAASMDPALTPLHCYGVCALNDTDGERWVHVLDPWKTVRGAHGKEHRRWTWEEVCRLFETLCINWRPSLLPHAQHLRGTWDAGRRAMPLGDGRVAQTAQYHLSVSVAQHVWVYLQRHDGVALGDDYMALHAFYTHTGQPRAHTESGGDMGTYVNLSYSLLRMELDAGEQLLLAASRHGHARSSAYTLSVYSDAPCAVRYADSQSPHTLQLHGMWRGRSCGGPWWAPTFRHNPQYKIVVGRDDLLPRLRVVLASSRQVCVHAALVRGSGERVTHLAPTHVVAASHAYLSGLAIVDVRALQPGTYTLVVSSREASASEFSVRLESSTPLRADALPVERAGLYRRSARGVAPCAWRITLRHAMPLLLVGAHDVGPEARVGADRLAVEFDGPAAQRAVTDEGAACCSVRTDTLPPGSYAVRVRAPAGAVALDAYGPQPLSIDGA